MTLNVIRKDAMKKNENAIVKEKDSNKHPVGAELLMKMRKLERQLNYPSKLLLRRKKKESRIPKQSPRRKSLPILIQMKEDLILDRILRNSQPVMLLIT
jgi:hypothetical protein